MRTSGQPRIAAGPTESHVRGSPFISRTILPRLVGAAGSGSRLVVAERNLRGFRGLTFDAYGALLDGGPKDVPAMVDRLVQETGVDLGHRSLKDLWATSFRKHMKTEPFLAFREVHRQAFQELFQRLNLSGDMDEWTEAAFERYRSAKAYPEVRPVVRELEPQVPLAVVSNMDTEVLLKALQRNALDFTFVITSEEEQRYKPSQALFQRAIRYLGLPPENILHVGDSYIEDVVGATSAGIEGLLIQRPGGLEDAPPQVKDVVRDLREVPERIRRSWGDG